MYQNFSLFLNSKKRQEIAIKMEEIAILKNIGNKKVEVEVEGNIILPSTSSIL